MTLKKERKPRPVGECWCGGNLYRSGYYTECDKCHRVRAAGPRPVAEVVKRSGQP